VTPQQILDTLERLLRAAQHPDVIEVYRYAQSHEGIGIVYSTRAKAFVWLAPDAVSTPAELPAELPPWETRVQHVLTLLVELLDAARPAGIDGWRTVAVGGTDLAPCGLEVRAGQTRVVLRVTAGGAQGKDSDPQDWAGWTIPAGIA
jgi:hypothetical protein